jgi:hypothetical protein
MKCKIADAWTFSSFGLRHSERKREEERPIKMRWLAPPLLLLLLGVSAADARGVSVNLTASWPSSPLFPLLETRCAARLDGRTASFRTSH